MDNEKLPEELADDKWLDNLLASPSAGEEIGPDEQAIASAGLTHPSDLELERIMRETMQEDWGADEAALESQLPDVELDFAQDEGPSDSVLNPEELMSLTAVLQSIQDEDDSDLDARLAELGLDAELAELNAQEQLDPADDVQDMMSVTSVLETFKDDEFRATFGEGEVLDQMFSDQPITPDSESAPAAPDTPLPAPEEDSPMEKGRPKRKKRYALFGIPHLAATLIWAAIILFIGVSIGRLGWICASDVLAFGREPINATVTISTDDTIDDIAEKLKDAGLIKYPGLFKLYANITKAMEDIKPGEYKFYSVDAQQGAIVYDYMALKSVLCPHASTKVIVSDLQIPEGYTCAQIFKLLEEKKVCTVAEMEAAVASDEIKDAFSGKYWFLEGVQWGDKYSLEGYLFPDTYDFYENDDPQRVLKKMLDAFDQSFTNVMKNNLATLNDRMEELMRKNGYGDDYIKAHQYTIRDVVIIASMIEKESANNNESFMVSSVIYNRLTNARAFPFLNIDATLVYALGGKADLTEEDLKMIHPYNTYNNPGLPPGAISCPGQNSLSAALKPDASDYYYYAFDPSTKEHHFSKTLKEHQAFLDSLKEAQ